MIKLRLRTALCVVVALLTFQQVVRAQQSPRSVVRSTGQLCDTCPQDTSNSTGALLPTGRGWLGTGIRVYQRTWSRWPRTDPQSYMVRIICLDWCRRCNMVGWIPRGGWVNANATLPRTMLESASAIHNNSTLMMQVRNLATVPVGGVVPGCHSCGSGLYRNQSDWIPDHIPPRAMMGAIRSGPNLASTWIASFDPLAAMSVVGFMPDEIQDELTNGYAVAPHCENCSRHQGGLVTKIIKFFTRIGDPWTSTNPAIRTEPISSLDTAPLVGSYSTAGGVRPRHTAEFRAISSDFRIAGFSEVTPPSRMPWQ
jgi:hypothetical protein